MAETFPCQDPFTPSMRDFHARYATFRTWPSNRMRATATELAEAGFIYLGTGDRLKCFYCNGGLQHWQFHEDPWVEHSKWYPNCEYLIRKRGLSFVENVVEQFPDINRPKMLPPPSTSRNPNSPPSPNSFNSHSLSPRPSVTQTVRSAVIACDEIPRSSSSNHFTSSRRSFAEAMNSTVVKLAIELGFEKDLIEKVVKQKIEKSKENYTTLSNMVDDLQKEEASLASTSSEECHMEVEFFQESDFAEQNQSGFLPSPISSTDLVQSNSPESVDDTYSVVDKIQHIKNESTCKVCLDREINSVFLPCGHLCCCIECSIALKTCPICRKRLEKIVKFYRNA